MRSLAVLLRQLHRAGFPLLLTVGTVTGVAQARELYRDLVKAPRPGRRGLSVQAAPWDLPFAVRRFLRATQPLAGFSLKPSCGRTSLPMHGMRRAAVPGQCAAHGEIAARLPALGSRGLMRDTVRAFTGIAAQSEADRTRFVSLGALPEKVSVGGSLKAELELPPEIGKLGAAWRAQWAPRGPLWVAGSTHAGEEMICLVAQRRLLALAREQGSAPPLLALAPRHPGRFDEVARELAAAGFTFARSTQPRSPSMPAPEVLLIDEMGALLGWYAAADVAFVGGSLVPVGGHNLMEPAMLGKPVLAGPHDANAPEIAQRLRRAGGLIVVQGAGELAARLAELLGDPAVARARGAQASAGALPEELGSRARWN